MGFAPYPGKVSARAVTAFWLVVALACFAFWAVVVLHLDEWRSLRAWALFATALYVRYWRSGLRAPRQAPDEVGDE